MIEDEQRELARIEKERRKREEELLLLLLAIFGTAKSHAVHAARSGNDPAIAARTVILGDNGGYFIGIAPIIAQAQWDAYEAGLSRVGKMSGTKTEVDAEIKQAAVVRYKQGADDYARDVSDKIGTGLTDVQLRALEPQEEVKQLRGVFVGQQITRNAFARLQAQVEKLICGAYADGMMAGYHLPSVAVRLTGLRHVSVLDDRTTEICWQRRNVQLPVSDPYWHTNLPPLHWQCRSVAMPIFGDFEKTPPEQMPTEPPMDGFGTGI